MSTGSSAYLNSLLSNDGPFAYGRITVRILLVIDGRVMLNHSVNSFGLGYVIDTLRSSPWFSPIHIELSLATREAEISDTARGGFDVLYKGFRFDQQSFRIDDWDQIWVFVDQPSRGESDPASDDLVLLSNPLGDEEVRLLVEWMDRGGGVFAVGDHNNLGACVGSRIPRVRTMRKWLVADGVPSQSHVNRNTTLQGPEADEFDLILQPLELVYTQSVTQWPAELANRPHPIMWSSAGPIDRFPDHMHEGQLFDDAEVKLDRPLDIPNYTRPEYPRAFPRVSGKKFGLEHRFPWTPRPSIIAYGYKTNPTFFAPTDQSGGSGGFPVGSRRFGIVGVYDGDAANIGRVVCDSTWHHWFNLNVYELTQNDPVAWRMMQSYYRNVALWLSRIPDRQRLLNALVWNVMAKSAPMEFTASQTLWQMGQRVLALITPCVGPSWVNELVASHVDATGLYRIRFPDGRSS